MIGRAHKETGCMVRRRRSLHENISLLSAGEHHVCMYIVDAAN